MSRASVIHCAVFTLILLSFAIGNVLVPDRKFSEMENRYLTAMPVFTFERLFSGKYGDDFEQYMNDQFPLRDFFMQASAAMQYAVGKREIGGVYFAGEGLLIERRTEINAELLDKNLQSVESLRKTGIPFYFALIPDAACIWGEKLPYGAPGFDQKELIDSIYGSLAGGCIDIFTALAAHKDEGIYYRTDHHWTTLGAYYGYEAVVGAMGMEPVDLADFSPETLSDGFFGTLYSKAPAFWVKPDEILAYAPDYDTEVAFFDGNEFKESSLYSMENLEKKDKYTVFLGGNQPVIIVETKKADEPRILVLRDSYFDSLTPFLQTHFSQIHLIDVRYYLKDIGQYAEENDIDIILAAYSVDQFARVVNLAGAVR